MQFDCEKSIGSILSRTQARMRNHLAKALKPYNVTTEQWALLVKLWRRDGISQKELSEQTQKDQPTITRILDKLALRELIVRTNNPEDRRAFLIFLTAEGQAIRSSLEEAAQSVLADALKGFSLKEQEQLRNFLNRIYENLD